MGEQAPMIAKEELATFSREDVAKHNTKDDCWVIIHGGVYDVTKYLDEHPGGPEIIHDVAGSDATEEFEDTGHSPEARDALKELKVGQVVGEAEKVMANVSVDSTSQKEGTNFIVLILVLLIFLMGCLYFVFIQQGNEPATVKEL